MLNKRIGLDFETRSESDLKMVGLYRYAEDPTTEILMASFALDNGPVHLWLPFEQDSVSEEFRAAVLKLIKPETGAHVYYGMAAPAVLCDWIQSGQEIGAHNAAFERILTKYAGKRNGLPEISIEQCVCTAAKAAAHCLPRALEHAAEALGTYPKKTIHTNDMRSLSKPRRGKEKWYTPQNDPQRWLNVIEYNIDDTRAERDLDKHIPDLSPEEIEDYRLDQRVNDRGVLVDVVSVRNMQALIEQYKDYLTIECKKMTGIERPSMREDVAAWVRERYPALPDLTVDTVDRLVKLPDVPPDVKRVLKIFSTYGAKAVAKFDPMIDMRCADGRLHGLFMYWGANTGRWSSSGVQLHNMARGVIEDPDTAIEAARSRDLDLLRDLYAGIDPVKVIASCTRGMLGAPRNKSLLAMDFAGIESRYTSWMFNEKWKIAAFLAQDDKTGPDVYRLGFQDTFGVAIQDQTKNDRQVGKVIELAVVCFEGGVGAFVKMAGDNNLDLDDLAAKRFDTLPRWALDKADWSAQMFGTKGLADNTFLMCDAIKHIARARHPHHVAGWQEMKQAAFLATKYPGKAFQISTGKVAFRITGEWLYMRLPCGGQIRYFQPQLENEEGDPKYQTISYMGVDTDTRQYKRTPTYGGRCTENAAQGGSNRLLRKAMHRMEAAGLPIVLHVHDEAAAEIGKGSWQLDAAMKIFTQKPAGFEDFPLAAEGWIGKRYRK